MQENDLTLIFRGGCRIENMGSLDENRNPSAELSDISVTLLSRDYKGLSNYASNGVIEIWKFKR